MYLSCTKPTQQTRNTPRSNAHVACRKTVGCTHGSDNRTVATGGPAQSPQYCTDGTYITHRRSEGRSEAMTLPTCRLRGLPHCFQDDRNSLTTTFCTNNLKGRHFCVEGWGGGGGGTNRHLTNRASTYVISINAFRDRVRYHRCRRQHLYEVHVSGE